MKSILSITGSDSTGLSGVQADVKTASLLGVGISTAVTSITVQSTLGIQSFYDVPAPIVQAQIEAVFNDEKPYVVKVGMMRQTDVVATVAAALSKYKPNHVIFDPVVLSSNGDLLMDEEVQKTIIQLIVPLATITIVRPDEDVVFSFGKAEHVINDLVKIHGNSNMFSSALAAFLCRGEDLSQAADHAREFLAQMVPEHSVQTGRITSLYNRFLDDVERYYVYYSDVAFYAEQLDISPRYLAQITRKISSRSPKAIIDERLAKEVELLLSSSDKTVQQIAYQLGFSSQAHLSKFFRKMRRVSPTEYRKGKPA